MTPRPLFDQHQLLKLPSSAKKIQLLGFFLQEEFRIQASDALVRPTSTSEAPSQNKSKSFKPAPPVGVMLPKYPTYVTIQVKFFNNFKLF